MKKRYNLIKIASYILAITMCMGNLSLPIVGATGIKAMSAPHSLIIQDTSVAQEPYATRIIVAVDSDALAFINEESVDFDALGITDVGHTLQIDWKLDDGPWHYISAWDTSAYSDVESYNGGYPDSGYLSGDIFQEVNVFDLRYEDEIEKITEAVILGDVEEDNRLDLVNHQFSFRVRTLISYYENDSQVVIVSPWSKTVAIGKGATTYAKPTSLVAPTISNLKLDKDSEGAPVIVFTAITPEQIELANAYIIANDNFAIDVEHEMNINNSGWQEASAGAWWLSDETRTVFVPEAYNDGKLVVVESASIQLRMRYVYAGGVHVQPMMSPWSNIVSINTPKWSKASPWATTELNSAFEYGLMPDILLGKDLTQAITREEFCELALLLYEKTTGKSAVAASPNPFKDTTNPQILKAYSLKITSGTSATTFSPLQLINREQCATMLYRTITAIKPESDYSVVGLKDFPDQKHISEFAIIPTKYMAKLGIIKGDASGNFMPKAITSSEIAAGYGRATREAALLMSVRTYEQLE